MLRWESEIFSAGSTGDTAHTAWQCFRVRYYRSHCDYWQYVIVRYCTYCDFGSCTSTLPKLRVFRGSVLQLLPVLAVIWEDTARIGNTLALSTADIMMALWAVLCLAVSTLILRVLAALRHISILPAHSEYDVYWDEHLSTLLSAS